jgi:hypothetical protein
MQLTLQAFGFYGAAYAEAIVCCHGETFSTIAMGFKPLAMVWDYVKTTMAKNHRSLRHCL